MSKGIIQIRDKNSSVTFRGGGGTHPQRMLTKNIWLFSIMRNEGWKGEKLCCLILDPQMTQNRGACYVTVPCPVCDGGRAWLSCSQRRESCLSRDGFPPSPYPVCSACTFCHWSLCGLFQYAPNFKPCPAL